MKIKFGKLPKIILGIMVILFTYYISLVIFDILEWENFKLLVKAGTSNTQNIAEISFSDMHWHARAAGAIYEEDSTILSVCKERYTSCYIHDEEDIANRFFLGTNTDTREHLISIRGTANLKNILLDLEFLHELDPFLQIPLHKGFATAAREVLTDVRPMLDRKFKIRLNGHSLGGGEAVVLSMLLEHEGFDVVQVITFGQPKVTNQAGIDKFSEKIPLHRVVHANDPIPTVPPIELIYGRDRFRHFGNETILLKDAYYTFLPGHIAKHPLATSFWMGLKNQNLFDELMAHRMSSYLSDLEPKLNHAIAVPFEDRDKYIQ
ncbi:MAG: lipase family protein [Candidatus Cloacimonetes bacterium]|nr:lipase family protein [Candidatus Cloacimonadota bacterium]